MKYKCNACQGVCVIETLNDSTYAPCECPSNPYYYSDWEEIKDAPQKIVEAKPEQPTTAPCGSEEHNKVTSA